MQPTNHFRAAVLAALALFATAATSHAQGLGGMLNRANAKVKAGQAGSARPTTTAQAAGQDNTGPIPENSPSPDNLTVENQQQYARALLNNRRPWLGVDKEHATAGDDYAYRRLRDEFKVPVKFTWDQEFVRFISPPKQAIYLWHCIDEMCKDLWPAADPSNKALYPYFKGPMSKVKEIHLTTTPKRVTEGELGAMEGYVFAFNPATGVLTAAVSTSTGYGPTNFDTTTSELMNFIIKKVK